MIFYSIFPLPGRYHLNTHLLIQLCLKFRYHLIDIMITLLNQLTVFYSPELLCLPSRRSEIQKHKNTFFNSGCTVFPGNNPT